MANHIFVRWAPITDRPSVPEGYVPVLSSAPVALAWDEANSGMMVTEVGQWFSKPDPSHNPYLLRQAIQAHLDNLERTTGCDCAREDADSPLVLCDLHLALEGVEK